MANEARPCPCDIGHKIEYGGLGSEVQIEHIKAYVSQPSSKSDKAVIVVQDIFGWQLPNTRYMADMIAANGYITICPDFFRGKEPWSPSNDWSTFQDWLKTRNPRNVDKEATIVLKYLKDKCHAQRIGIVGFCWGGVVVHDLMMKFPELKAGVSVYGIIRDSEDVYGLKNPTFFIFGEKDTVIPLEQVTLLTQKLKEHCKVSYQIKTFPGQTHGFVHRQREDWNPEDKPYIEEARKDLIDWLNLLSEKQLKSFGSMSAVTGQHINHSKFIVGGTTDYKQFINNGKTIQISLPKKTPWTKKAMELLRVG